MLFHIWIVLRGCTRIKSRRLPELVWHISPVRGVKTLTHVWATLCVTLFPAGNLVHPPDYGNANFVQCPLYFLQCPISQKKFSSPDSPQNPQIPGRILLERRELSPLICNWSPAVLPTSKTFFVWYLLSTFLFTYFLSVGFQSRPVWERHGSCLVKRSNYGLRFSNGMELFQKVLEVDWSCVLVYQVIYPLEPQWWPASNLSL